MRQPRPGAGRESGLQRLILFSVLWLFTLLAPAILATPDARSVAVEKFRGGVVKFRDVVNGRRSVNVATGSGSGAALTNGVRREINDFELEDFVLLATVDGRLSARDRQTGSLRWELVTQEPSVQSTYHKRRTATGGRDLKKHGASIDEDENVVWMVSPTENGELYFYTHEGKRLQKLGVSLKDIVHNMPYRPPGLDTVYNGSKNTTMYAINAKTGMIEKVFNPLNGMVNKKCITTPDADGDEAGVDCVDADGEPERLVMIGRTEYIISIQNYRTGELLWTIKYKEWTPNNSDMDLRMQHNRPKDNRYIYSRHDGFIFGFEELEGAPADEKTPKFSVELPSPVIRVFDVIKYSGEDETLDSEDLLVLPQPGIRTREDGREDRTFVGFTEEGTCFAMSEEDFPYVTDRASEAKCYDRTAEWDQLPEVERRKLLVGVHRTHGPETNNFNNPHMLSLPGRESDTGNSRKESTSPSPHVHSTLTLTPGLWESGQYPKVLGTIAAVFLCAIWIASKAANIERFRPNAAKLPSESPANEVLGNLTSDAMQPQQPPQALVDKPLPSLPVQPIPDGSLPDAVEIAVGDNTVEVPTIVAEPAAPKTSGVRFVDEPAILELPKVEEETAAEELPRATTPVQEHDAVPPTTPEGKKKKRQRGRRGGKNTKKKDQSESTSEAAEKTEDEREEEKEKEKETKMKNIVISDGDVKEMNPGTSYVLNKLEIDEQDVIGLGSCGTTVYRGRWEGKAVAVKRILSNYADIAEKEVRTLQESDYHQNVIRYYCRQQSGAFLFIALELCPGSLHDFVFAKDKFSPEMLAHSNPRDTLLQIMHGLHHLHELKIVHRDIKPQNILVGEPKGKDKRPRFLISDFGLCRKLQQDEYSFGATTAQQAGTVGWRARELLTDAVTGLASGISPSSGNHNNQENTEASSSSASGTDMVVDPLTKRRATRAIDIFAMGCVCYFVLSGGHHPFGERFTRELNIVNQAFNLSHLDDNFFDASGHEAKNLISAMISGDPKKRPDTAKVGAHPFFWKTEKRLDFLCAVSDRFELEEQREKADRTAKKPNPYVSPFIAMLETRAREVLGEEGWMKRLDRHLVHELGLNKRRGYDEKKVLHLLRMIRNKSHHFQDMTPAARDSVGEPPDRFYDYFAHRFPKLLMEVYEMVREAGWNEEVRFGKFFVHPWGGV